MAQSEAEIQRQKEMQQAEELLFSGRQELGFAKGLFLGNFVADSDGTLIISNGEPISGTRETLDRSIEMRKPYLVIDSELVDIGKAIELAIAFIRSLSFRAPQTARNPANVRVRGDAKGGPSHSLGMTIVLNVAGPRASQWPEGHKIAEQIVSTVLRRLSGQNDANEYSA